MRPNEEVLRMTTESWSRAISYIGLFLVLMLCEGVLGLIFTYSMAGFFYRIAHPGPVTNSYECAHGMMAGLCALVGGGLGGASVGCYHASKVIYLNGAVETEAMRVWKRTVWETILGRDLRTATHHACAGALVISFAAFSNPDQFLLMFLLGLVAMIFASISAIRAHVLSSNLLSSKLDENL
jgi:hypothetical protein